MTVDEYVAALPAAARNALNDARHAIRKAVPEVDEGIGYEMLAYKLRGTALASAPLIAKFERELRPYAIDRGTVRFPLSEAMPTELIERIARFRAGELTRGGAGQARPGRRSKLDASEARRGPTEPDNRRGAQQSESKA